MKEIIINSELLRMKEIIINDDGWEGIINDDDEDEDEDEPVIWDECKNCGGLMSPDRNLIFCGYHCRGAYGGKGGKDE